MTRNRRRHLAAGTLVPDRETQALRLSWSVHDTHRWVTVGAPVGLAIAAALVVVGLPAIDLHPPTHRLGIMDPGCGMTRGVVALLGGHPARAVRYNPASPLVALAGLAGIVRAIVGGLWGRWLTVRLRWTPSVLVIVGLLVLALEVRQQFNADLLTA